MTYYGYCLYDGGQTFHGTGTVTLTAGSAAVVGVSTVFTTELVVGAVLFVGTQTVAVSTITDNTHLTLQSEAATNASGLAFDYNDLVNVETISPGIFPPKSRIKPYAEYRDVGNGLRRGCGKPVGAWQWGYLSQQQRDALRNFIPNADLLSPGVSIRSYVRTRYMENLDAYLTFEAVLIWPDEETRSAFQPTKPSREEFVLGMRDMILL
jgi:hypothetical protein